MEFASWFASSDDDELVPQDGKDEIYDTNAQEIKELTEELDAKLEEYGEELGFVSLVVILGSD